VSPVQGVFRRSILPRVLKFFYWREDRRVQNPRWGKAMENYGPSFVALLRRVDTPGSFAIIGAAGNSVGSWTAPASRTRRSFRRREDVRCVAKAVSSLRFATALHSTSGLWLLGLGFSSPAEV
jgi:hypothetical protein